MTSDITEEMVASAHAEYCHTGSDTRWNVRMRRAIQAALAARPIEAGSVKIQRYELTPHGTLKEAADGWWTSADAAEAAIAERDERIERERSERNEYRKRSAHFSALYLNEQDRAERLEKALQDIAKHPEKYDDGKRSYAVGWAFHNVRAIARAALQQEGERDE